MLYLGFSETATTSVWIQSFKDPFQLSDSDPILVPERMLFSSHSYNRQRRQSTSASFWSNVKYLQFNWVYDYNTALHGY